MPISYLFSPADNAHKIEKAFSSDTNALILDLEDGVALAQKVIARKVLLETIAELRNQQLINKPFYIRCNSAKSTFIQDDITLIQQIHPAGVMLPKCEFTGDIEFITQALPDLEVLPLIETVAGIRQLQHLNKIHSSVKRLAFGAVDYALDLGTAWTISGAERDYAMNQIVFFSRVLELAPPVDAVFPLLNNPDAYSDDVLCGKQKGFHGKMAIHPAQLTAIHDAYYLSPDELQWHRKVVDAYKNFQHTGAFELDGKLIDLPVYRHSRLILDSVI